MAETKIKIVVDDSGVTKFIDSAGEEITKFADGLKESRLELKRIQDAIASGVFNGDELLKLQKRAGELKDKMSDLAEETRANAGNSFEGFNNNLALTSDRLMNLDFEGVSSSLKGLTANAKSLTFKEMRKGLEDAVAGLWNLAKAILSNPILMFAGIITGIIVYWKELNGLFNMAETGKLEKQKKILESELKTMESQLAVEKAKGTSIDKSYTSESAILRKKIQIATEEEKLARLKGDTDAVTEAIKNKEQGIYDLKVLQAQLEGKIIAGVEEAKRTTDEAYGLQAKKNDAAKTELDAIESIKTKNKEDIEIAKEKASLAGFMNVFYSKQAFTIDEINEAQRLGLINESQGLRWIKNEFKARESVENIIRKNAGDRMNSANAEVEQIKQIINGRKGEYALLKSSAQVKMDGVKSEEELAKIEEDKRKKEERDAEAKRKREERLAKLEEARKKLAEEVLVIEKEMEEFQRRNMTPREAELFQLKEKYLVQKATLEQAKVSKKELEELENNYLISRATINKKFDDEEYLKNEAIRQKELARVEEQFQLLQQLTSTAKEKEINDAVLNSEKQYETANNDAQTELAIKLELENKIAEINKKYADEEIKTAKEKSDALIEIDQKNAEKRQAIRDFVVQQIGNALSIISGMQELGLQNELRIADAQHQTEEQKDKIRKKYFEKQKQVQIAQALLSTFESAVNMFNAVSKSPITTAFPAAPFIATASAVALGLLNVAKIRNTQFSGGGSSSSSTAQAPSFSSLSTPQPSMNGVNVQGQQDQPVFQTYVVSGTITDNQELSQLIYNQSKL
jgi:hypothetical protein